MKKELIEPIIFIRFIIIIGIIYIGVIVYCGVFFK